MIKQPLTFVSLQNTVCACVFMVELYLVGYDYQNASLKVRGNETSRRSHFLTQDLCIECHMLEIFLI